MVWYLVKKVLFFILSLYLVATLTFFLMKAVPGDPFTQEQVVPKEIIEAMRNHYGLDKPWYVQYGKYMKGVMVGDLGPSFKHQGLVTSEIIRKAFPVSLCLGIPALFLALFFGVFIGVLGALRRSQWHGVFCGFLGVVGISIPGFILAACVQYVFAMKLDVLPVALWGSFKQAILPIVSLAVFPMACIMRLMRSSVLQVLQQEYILTARSKGLSWTRIIWCHLLRNALLPVISYMGPLVASVLTGSLVVEKVFGIPGLGQWFVSSVISRDYTVIMGLTVFYSAVLMVSTFIVDFLYCILDPRVRVSSQYG